MTTSKLFVALFGVAALMGSLSADGPHAVPPGERPVLGQSRPLPSQAEGQTSAASTTRTAPAQQATQQQPPPEQATDPQQPFRTGINFVRVDVIVSDRDGKPVADLAESDFEVLEDGKVQKIEAFRFVQLSGQTAPDAEPAREIRSDYVEEAEAARDDVRLFAIFLDDYHVRRGASLVVREPLMRFLQNEVGPLDMVALMYPLTPVSDMRFSRNKDLLSRAVNEFLGRKYDYDPKNQFEAEYSNYPVEVVERVRNEVSLSALKALVTRLGGMREGRKAVVVVSEGYSYYVPPQLRSGNAQFTTPFRSPTLGDNDPNEDRARFMSQSDIQQDLQRVYDAANRANTALYTLDPRGLATFEFDINESVGMRQDQDSLRDTQDSLRVLADQTDGRAIVNRNDLAGGLKQIVKDSSAYYLLGYNSTEAPADGKFHEIKVRVKRPRVDVRARKGYWALTAEETARATGVTKAPEADRAVGEALASLEVPRRMRAVRTWMGSAKGENGRTRVTFVWEPIAPTGGERREAPNRISLMAAGSGGTPYFRGRVPDGAAADTGPSNSGAAATNGAAVDASKGGRIEFDAPPGALQLRLSIEGAGGNVLDTDILETTVPDFTGPTALISTPAVLRARTVPELRALMASADARPTTERVFRRADRVVLRFSVYGPGGAGTEVAARLLNRAGTSMADLKIEAVGDAASGSRQIAMPLSTLPNGDYLVEVSASAGDERSRQLVAFRMSS